ncbi:hypothetical protein P4S72_17125 [Vibrio sp. PP-XX7]
MSIFISVYRIIIIRNNDNEKPSIEIDQSYFLIITSCFSAAYAEKAPDSLNSLIPQLKAWGADPVLVKAVKAQNSQNISLDVIKKKDMVWQKHQMLMIL